MPDHLILPMIKIREGAPIDQGVVIDGNFFKLQVKTAEKITNGKMTFRTIKSNGDKYTDKEVDYFLLHCIETNWSGLALPSECTSTIAIYNRPTMSLNSYHAEDFDFLKRMRELVETGKIRPVQYGVPVEEYIEELPAPFFKKPDTWEEMYNLLEKHGGTLEELSESIHVSIPTLLRWINDFTLMEEADGVVPV